MYYSTRMCMQHNLHVFSKFFFIKKNLVISQCINTQTENKIKTIKKTILLAIPAQSKLTIVVNFVALVFLASKITIKQKK